MFDRANMGSIYTFVTDDTLLIFNKVWELIEKDKQQLVDLDKLAGMTSFIGFINFRVGCRPSCQDV